MKEKQLKIRASSAFKLLGKSKKELTENQREEIKTLQAKEKRTAIQEKKLSDLIERLKYDGELSGTAKTYALEVYADNEYKRRDLLQTDAILKGIAMEDSSFDMVMRVLGVPLMKNIERLENDYFTGEIDSSFINKESKKVIVDIKNKESLKTFLKLTNKVEEDAEESKVDLVYYTQMNVYMDLNECDEAWIIHTLQSMPEEIIVSIMQKDIYSLIKFNPFFYKNSLSGSTTDWSIELLEIIHCSKDEILERMYSLNYLTGDVDLDGKIIDVAKQVYLNNYFDNINFGYIPENKRVYIEKVYRDDELLDKLKKKVVDFRDYYKTIRMPEIKID